MGNFDYSGRKVDGNRPYSGYAASLITISGVVTDYSLQDNSTLFEHVTNPIELLMRNGSAAISFKFNTAANDSIRLSASSDFGIQGYTIQDVLVTTSGAASFDVFTLGWR